MQSGVVGLRSSLQRVWCAQRRSWVADSERYSARRAGKGRSVVPPPPPAATSPPVSFIQTWERACLSACPNQQESEEGHAELLAYGLAAMQGWRVSMVRHEPNSSAPMRRCALRSGALHSRLALNDLVLWQARRCATASRAQGDAAACGAAAYSPARQTRPSSHPLAAAALGARPINPIRRRTHT